MAKYFSRVPISDIMDVDISEFMSWDRSQLAEAVRKLGGAANKRIKRLDNAMVASRSLYDVMHSGGKFTTAGKTLNELRSEFIRAKDFLSEPDSTVKGAREFWSYAIDELKKRGIEFDNKAQLNSLILDYFELQDKDPSTLERTMKYMLMRNTETFTSSDSRSIEGIANRVVSALDATYNPGGTQYDGVSEFFELE